MDMPRRTPTNPVAQTTVEVPKVQFLDKEVDGHAKTGPCPSRHRENCRGALQDIDRVVNDPAVMQREASIIEARDDQDCPRGPRRDAAGPTRQADDVSAATPRREVDHPKKRRKAVEQDLDQSPQDQNADALDLERFQDLVLPSSQSCLERETLCARIASSDEGGGMKLRNGSTEGRIEAKQKRKEERDEEEYGFQ